METKGISNTGFFMYLAPYLNLAAYNNERGDLRFTKSTDKANTFHVNDILNYGRITSSILHLPSYIIRLPSYIFHLTS